MFVVLYTMNSIMSKLIHVFKLSKYNLSPRPTGHPPVRRRSLDREPVVLTKWSHSAGVEKKPLSEPCRVLNVTKITDCGKKVRKNWTQCWTDLQGSTLRFHSGQGQGGGGGGGTSWFGGNQSKPELTVELRGGAVEWASKDKSSKKHVIELKTQQGTELLIQSKHNHVITHWYQALQDTISNHAWGSNESTDEDLPDSPDSEKRGKDRGSGRHGAQRVETCDFSPSHSSSSSSATRRRSDMNVSDKTTKTRRKLKKFLTRRPTLQDVRDKGYIQDQVFGCSLSSLCHRENSTVPSFVKTCIDHVENTSLCVDGLYRVSGNLAVIQKLRFAVDHDQIVNLAEMKWNGIHTTTGALKMYFRELPEPIFTYSLFHDFVSAIKHPDYKQRVHSIKDLVKQLPKPNHDTMQVLFKHLRRVIDHSQENRMSPGNVAIVFGPTLMRPEIETGNMVQVLCQSQIVELILLQYKNIFGR